MRKIWLALAFLGFLSVQAHAQWKPVEGKIKTRWAEQVNPDNVLPEYPRPIMERAEWKNLNGLWEYAIIEKGSHTRQVCRTAGYGFHIVLDRKRIKTIIVW